MSEDFDFIPFKHDWHKNKNTLHKSTPILTDKTKYIMSIWTRHKKLR